MNGYKNWETWNVVLWLMDDESLYEDVISWGTVNDEEAEANVRALLPEGTPDFSSEKDLDKVDWVEVADMINEE